MVAPRLADVSPYKSCLCHNDLNPKNCLSDELHFWVIDWEYAGMGDPLFDLAIVAESHNLTDPQREVLVTHYDEKLPLKMTLMQLDRYQELYLLREMAWLLLKHVVTPDDLASLQCYYAFKDKLTQRLTPDSAGAAEQIAR
jgi:thiamine kinase-like enzyme